jgi:hypothetical protein
MPLETWRAVRARWNEKNAPEESEPGATKMVFKNTD